MTGERSTYPLRFHRFQERHFEDYESLARLFQSRLTAPPSLHQLPPDLDRFAGRQAKSEDAIALLQRPELRNSSTPIVLAISGRAGVGKSTLAVHIAHQVEQSFPDAQLYVDLRGHDRYPLQPTEVLAHLLRVWGVSDSAMPHELEERSQLLRLFLHDKRTLLLLDNVRDEEQVRLLIPKNGCCAVLITSRKRFYPVPDATLMDLAEMSEIAALELLQQFVSVTTIRAEPEVGLSAVNLCNRLPLAICTFGRLLQHQPELALREAVEQLSEVRSHIKQNQLDQTDIRASFDLVYQQLEPTAARLLRLLGLLVELSFTLDLATVLLECEPDIAREAIQELVVFRLLEGVSGDRYRFVHHLIRLLAQEQLAIEASAEEQQAARLRVCQFYLEATALMSLGLETALVAEVAQVLSRKSRKSVAILEQKVFNSALNWFQTEQLNLLMAIEWAYQAEDWVRVIAIAENLFQFYAVRRVEPNWERIHHLSLDAAWRLNDRLQQAFLWNNLGNVYTRQHLWHRARESYEQSLTLFKSLARPVDKAQTLVNFGTLYAQQEQPQDAVGLWHTALTELAPYPMAQKRLKQWMQSADRLLFQQTLAYKGDRQPARSLFQTLVQTLRIVNLIKPRT